MTTHIVSAPIDELLEQRKLLQRLAATPGRPAVDLSPKDQGRYSLPRGILAMANLAEAGKDGAAAPRCFELEVSEELAKHFPPGATRRGGLLVPTFTNRDHLPGFAKRAGLDSATSTKGSELKFIMPGDFLDLFRNRIVVGAAGVTFLQGLRGPVTFPKQSGSGTASWVGENPGSDVADSNLTLGTVALVANTLMSSTSYSRQVMMQATVDLNAKVVDDLSKIVAIELDRAVINGSGAGNQPSGILNVSGVDKTTVAGGTNGAQPTFGNFVDLETIITGNNADVLGPLAYVTTPQIRGRAKQTTQLSNTRALPLWTKPGPESGWKFTQGGGSRGVGEVNGYPAFASANVPSTLTKGTASGICHAILFGAFGAEIVGDWGMYELVIDPYRLKKQGMIELTVFSMFGIACQYPAAFAAMVDCLK